MSFVKEKTNTTFICYASTFISIFCISLILLILPFLQMLLNSTSLNIEKRMEIFKQSSRNVWQEITIIKSNERIKRQGKKFYMNFYTKIFNF